MATETTNLGLHVVPSSDYTKSFDDWRKEMASDETTSNMVIIDTAIAGKMDKENPVGTGAFSMNRKADSTVGEYSSTLGDGCIASGDYSHAEGQGTEASGSYSHAEGYGTEANGYCNHAEGYCTRADGSKGSHAEGQVTIASGDFGAHSEGYNTTASGNCSHAEGWKTTASGSYSHAEGHYTTAQGKSQHVQGEYNVLDTEGTTTSRGKYAHIVGNGTSNSARSNAHTLDWSGNAWFAGDVYVGGTGQDDTAAVKLVTATELATKQDVINLTASRAIVSDSSGKLVVAAVTSDELGYLSGVTSNIQTQLNGKQATLSFDSAPTSGSSNPVTSGGVYTALAGKEPTISLTTGRALISDSSGKLAVSAVTSTELGYLDGVTSNVQTQLNGKQATLSFDTTPTSGSANPVTSGGVYTALNGSTMVSVTGSTTLGATHAGKFINANSTSAITITIPAGTTIPVGSEIEIWRGNSGTVTITGASTAVYVYIPGNSAAVVLSNNQVSIGDQYASVTLKHIASGYWSIQPAQ